MVGFGETPGTSCLFEVVLGLVFGRKDGGVGRDGDDTITNSQRGSRMRMRGDILMIIRNIARQSREPDEWIAGKRDARDGEAVGPLVPSLVLNLKIEEVALHVGKLELGSDVRPAEVDRASTQGLRIAVIAKVIFGVSIQVDSKNTRETVRVTFVGVSVENDSKSSEHVYRGDKFSGIGIR